MRDPSRFRQRGLLSNITSSGDENITLTTAQELVSVRQESEYLRVFTESASFQQLERVITSIEKPHYLGNTDFDMTDWKIQTLTFLSVRNRNNPRAQQTVHHPDRLLTSRRMEPGPLHQAQPLLPER